MTTMKGKFQIRGEPNKNKTIYPKSELMFEIGEHRKTLLGIPMSPVDFWTYSLMFGNISYNYMNYFAYRTWDTLDKDEELKEKLTIMYIKLFIKWYTQFFKYRTPNAYPILPIYNFI